MSREDALRDELVQLRRGRATADPALLSRLGPLLAELSGVRPGDSDQVARQRVRSTLAVLAQDLPVDLRHAAEHAFALHVDAPARLAKRIETLTGLIHCGDRTARRRMDEAARLMARGGVGPAPATVAGPRWRVSAFSALLRLDTPTPELYETRSVVANRPLAELLVRFDLPRPDGHDGPAPPLAIDVLYGARITSIERRNAGRHYRVTVSPPRPLEPDGQFEFCLHYRVPQGQPIRSHYAIVPLDPVDHGRVRVRFGVDRPPVTIWRLAEVPPRLLDDAASSPTGDPLAVDGVGEVALVFRGLREGHGYGVAWRAG